MAGQFGYLRSFLSSHVQDSYEFCHSKNATYYHRVDDPGACCNGGPHLDRRHFCTGSNCMRGSVPRCPSTSRILPALAQADLILPAQHRFALLHVTTSRKMELWKCRRLALAHFSGWHGASQVLLAGNFSYCTVPNSGQDALLFGSVAVLVTCVLQGKLSAVWVLIAGARSSCLRTSWAVMLCWCH